MQEVVKASVTAFHEWRSQLLSSGVVQNYDDVQTTYDVHEVHAFNKMPSFIHDEEWAGDVDIDAELDGHVSASPQSDPLSTEPSASVASLSGVPAAGGTTGTGTGPRHGTEGDVGALEAPLQRAPVAIEVPLQPLPPGCIPGDAEAAGAAMLVESLSLNDGKGEGLAADSADGTGVVPGRPVGVSVSDSAPAFEVVESRP